MRNSHMCLLMSSGRIYPKMTNYHCYNDVARTIEEECQLFATLQAFTIGVLAGLCIDATSMQYILHVEMEDTISKERLKIIVRHNFYPDADDVLMRLEEMEWNGGRRREHKDFGVKGVSYDLKFGGYNGIPVKTIHREVMDWEYEPLIMGIKDIPPLGDCDYCVVQRYADGTIGMKRHKDDEMDTRPIYGLSLGATRTLVLYPPPFNKVDREPVRISLPHNSLYMILPPTNKYWMHSIEEDLSVKDVRYSMTFRKSR